jgi:alcohol dehydrogenase class IV
MDIDLTPAELELPRLKRVYYGNQSVESYLKPLASGLMKRPFLLTTGSLERNGLLAQLQAVMGEFLVGTFAGSKAHNPLESVRACAAAARDAQADGLIVFGGSSVVDLAKSVAMILAEGDDIDAMRIRFSPETGMVRPDLTQPKVPQIVIPTTLSGSEYTAFMAITDHSLGTKLMFGDDKLAAHYVIQDPHYCMPTPDRLWAGTGMKVLADTLEMLGSRRARPMTNLYALEGLRVLVENLPRGLGPDSAPEARQFAHYGAYLAMSMGFNASLGLVAGLRHQIGAGHGVAHGEASTIVLPHVLRWNKDHAQAAYAKAAETLNLAGASEAARADALIAHIEQMIAGFGLPLRLRDVGVAPDALQGIADHVTGDPSIAFNPRPVTQAAEVLEVLQAAY